MKDLNIKVSFGKKTDGFLAENRLAFRVLKFMFVLALSIWMLNDITALKHVEYSARLYALLSISWYVVLKLLLTIVFLHYEVPQRHCKVVKIK